MRGAGSARKSEAEAFVRPLVRRLKAYVPGEQPKEKGLIKLNTNENPYPPPASVLRAICDAVDGRLRLYPNPRAQRLRERLAQIHGCSPEQVIIGNGSDELLALACRAFVEAATPAGRRVSPKRYSQETVQFFTPSYSLYPVLAGIAGARVNAVPLRADFDLPGTAELGRAGLWDFDAGLTFVTTPNAPTGRAFARRHLESLCRAQRGVVVLDEAYVDFAEENALELSLRHPHVLVSRTFSKAYSLCFQRVGYCVGHSRLIEALDKIRDSYNVNGLGQVAALAALDERAYYKRNFRRIVQGRNRLAKALLGLGFQVLPSQTNFILVRPPLLPAHVWLGRLREARILVRWFDSPEVKDYLRITIGTEKEMRTLLRAVKAIVDAERGAGV